MLDKKKGAIAIGLILIMIFMWVRLIAKKSPSAAKASQNIVQSNNQEQEVAEPKSSLEFVELPFSEDRHDAITRDIFVLDSARLTSKQQASVIVGDSSDKNMSRVVKLLKLEAIELGEHPNAFINDQLCSVGDELKIKDGANEYVFEILKIEEKKVFVKFGETEIVLKFEDSIEVSDYEAN
jgi:hypothetical protein